MRLVDVGGWYGTVAIVLAYALVAWSYSSPESLGIILLNLTGAVGVGISVWRKRVWSALVLQLVWILIAFVALARLF